MEGKDYKSYLIIVLLLIGLLLTIIPGKKEQNSGTAAFQSEQPETESKPIDAAQPETAPPPQTEAQPAENQPVSSKIELVAPDGDAQIRVQICSGNYESKFHQSITLTCTTDYTVKYGDKTEEHKASEPVWFTPDDPWLAQGTVTLEPKEGGRFHIPKLQRSQENPGYDGKFIIQNTDQGILVINQLPLETYLYSVVPSEMPSTYPLEALKAQAICARTYATRQIQAAQAEGREVDVDDSVSFQVYNNIARTAATDQAVDDTAGYVMMAGEELAEALYYSTSCGIDLTKDYSEETVFASFMQNEGIDSYEQDEAWYRWRTYFSLEQLTGLAEESFPGELGKIKEVVIVSRDQNGAIQNFKLVGEKGEKTIEGEYSIRMFLKTNQTPVTLQDGSEAPDLGMLPSAYFYLIPDPEGYTLVGGGYGHGKGMSQNGARHMADAGKDYQQILHYYYGS